MAVDKLVDSTQLDSDLTSVANAIRTKGGTSASLAFPADFVSAIAAIPSGGMPVSVLDHEVVTPTAKIKKANALELNLTPCTNFVVVGYVEDDITADSTDAQFWAGFRAYGLSLVGNGAIMRTDGTQGSDSSWGSFTSSTGVLKVPNSAYSNLMPNKTYHFWLFEIGGVASA